MTKNICAMQYKMIFQKIQEKNSAKLLAFFKGGRKAIANPLKNRLHKQYIFLLKMLKKKKKIVTLERALAKCGNLS
jgi:hypothetical protein